ncbi:glycosyltransferase [hydrocarbon metagenome]|uniref:Glycosyltransferase n=1 Tax=hydrocarbon metagenome TaxID=938273 RepID=A0A0W8E2S8_9ZZZZ
MRILIGADSFYPYISGVSVTTLNLASYLSAQGHEVVVIAPSKNRRNYKENFDRGFLVWRVGSIPNPFRKDLRMGVYKWRQLRGFIASWNPDIIHLQDPGSIGLALLGPAKAQMVPIIVSHHFTLDFVLSYLRFLRPAHTYVRKSLSSALIRFYNSCQHIVCPSQMVKQELLDLGLKKPVTVVSNGVNLDRFINDESNDDIRSRYDLPKEPLVLYVGRIAKEKNIETLIRSIPLVLGRVKAHFVLCGGGELVEDFSRLIERMGLSDNVSFLGQIDYQSSDLPQIYRSAACFAIPAKMETQSIVTLEAMASGLPIVAARAGALPELVADGDNGFLFNPGDSEELAKKICRLLEDDNLSQAMGQRSIVKVVQHEINSSLQIIEEIYYEVVNNAVVKASKLG